MPRWTIRSTDSTWTGACPRNDTVLLLASGASGVKPDPDQFIALVA
jgi:hypothetical protein